MALNLIKRLVLGRKLTHEEGDQNWSDIETAVNGKAPLSHSHSISNITGLTAELAAKLPTSARGSSNGVASLGADGKVPLSQLPAIDGMGLILMPKAATITEASVNRLAMLDEDGKATIWQPEPNLPGSGGTHLVVFSQMTDKGGANWAALSIFKIENATALTKVVRLWYTENDAGSLMSVDFTFVSGTPSSPTEVEIGADDDETNVNFDTVFNAWAATSAAGRVEMDATTFSTTLLLKSTFLSSHPNNFWKIEQSNDSGATFGSPLYFQSGSGGETAFIIGGESITSTNWNSSATNVVEEAAAFANAINLYLSDIATAVADGANVTITPANYEAAEFEVEVVLQYPSGAISVTPTDTYVPERTNFIGLPVIGVIKEITGENVLLQVSGVAEVLIDEDLDEELSVADFNAGLRSGNPPIAFKMAGSNNGTAVPIGFLVFTEDATEDTPEQVSVYAIGFPVGDIVPGEVCKVLLSLSNLI